MFSLLITILLLYLAFRVGRLLLLPALRQRQAAPRSPAVPAEMIACSACGTFVLAAEVHHHNGKCYCGDSCLNHAT